MLEKVLYPLLVANEFPRLYGKTRFQKLTFLIQKEAERQKIEGPKFKYTIYLHGPFSFQLNQTMKDLVHDGFLKEGFKETVDGNYVYFYRLTGKGRDLLKEAQHKGLIGKTDLKIVSEVTEKYGHIRLDQLVEEAYRQYGFQKNR